MELAGLHEELADADAGEIFHALGDILLDARGRRAVFCRPLAQALPLVVSVPETAVEDASEALVPAVGVVEVGAVADGLQGL